MFCGFKPLIIIKFLRPVLIFIALSIFQNAKALYHVKFYTVRAFLPLLFYTVDFLKEIHYYIIIRMYILSIGLFLFVQHWPPYIGHCAPDGFGCRTFVNDSL